MLGWVRVWISVHSPTYITQPVGQGAVTNTWAVKLPIFHQKSTFLEPCGWANFMCSPVELTPDLIRKLLLGEKPNHLPHLIVCISKVCVSARSVVFFFFKAAAILHQDLCPSSHQSAGTSPGFGTARPESPEKCRWHHQAQDPGELWFIVQTRILSDLSSHWAYCKELPEKKKKIY